MPRTILYRGVEVDVSPPPPLPVARAVPPPPSPAVTVRIPRGSELPVPPVPVQRYRATPEDLIARARQSGFTLETAIARWLAENPSQIEGYFGQKGSTGGISGGYFPLPESGDRRGTHDYGSDDEFVLTGSKNGGLRGTGSINTGTMLLLGGGALGLFLLLNKK